MARCPYCNSRMRYGRIAKIFDGARKRKVRVCDLCYEFILEREARGEAVPPADSPEDD